MIETRPFRVAQEVEKVFPDMVSTDERGFKRVNYGQLPYLMLQAARELKAQKDKLQQEMRAKEARKDAQIQKLTQRVQELQKVQQQMAAFEARLAQVEGKELGASARAAAHTKPAAKPVPPLAVTKVRF